MIPCNDEAPARIWRRSAERPRMRPHKSCRAPLMTIPGRVEAMLQRFLRSAMAAARIVHVRRHRTRSMTWRSPRRNVAAIDMPKTNIKPVCLRRGLREKGRR